MTSANKDKSSSNSKGQILLISAILIMSNNSNESYPNKEFLMTSLILL